MRWKTKPPISGSAIPARMVVMLGLTALIIVGYGSWKQSARYDRTGGRPAHPELRELGLPHVIGGGLTMAQGLQRFSGKELSPPDGVQLSALLGSILVFLVTGPTLLAFVIRRRLLRSSPDIPGVMTLLGLITGASWMVAAIPLTVLQSDIRETHQQSWMVQRTRDELVRDLLEVRIAALQFAALPSSNGGGSGSFDGFEIPSELRVTRYGTLRDSVSGSSLILRATLDVPWSRVVGRDGDVPPARIGMSLDPSGRVYDWTYEGIFR